ncbi:hypothetical protein ACRB8A_14335 [Arthrobacter sp. G.S.26]|uniref:hypothetical protein n=1 Tax=Arthrobacter sp. G.S.26 TaxID=3433706 RepID=UPI003D783FAE
MQHTITPPTTVRELEDVAGKLDMDLPEVMDLLGDALGENWWNEEHNDFILRTEEPAAPPTTQVPARPALVPHGFTPLDGHDDLYEGKRIESTRWTIIAEYTAHTGDFSVAFWTKDDDPMTAEEVSEYAYGLISMGSYIAHMRDSHASATAALEGTQAPA